jgi:HAMP domain-containing protein
VAALVMIVALLALNASRVQKPQTPMTAKIEKPVESGDPSAVRHTPTIQTSEQGPLANTKTQRVQHKGVTRQKPLQQQLGPHATSEIATDFIPLTSREALAQMDGGQVIRVELPRSALMSFGLPMDMERATERIKADVVVGNDGLARAIRFVR